jgi:hypothetical protein
MLKNMESHTDSSQTRENQLLICRKHLASMNMGGEGVQRLTSYKSPSELDESLSSVSENL